MTPTALSNPTTPAAPAVPDTTAPAAALAAARVTREDVVSRNLPVGDPARDEALSATLGSLRESWSPELSSYVRRGPQTGRLISDDPVRVLRREMNDEMRRIQRMLRRAPGAATPNRPPKYAPWEPKQLRGRIGQAHRVINGLVREHEAALAIYGAGRLIARSGGRGYFRSMVALNEEAAELLQQLQAERRSLKLGFERYCRWYDAQEGTHALADEYDKLADALAEVRALADVLRDNLRESVARRTPLVAPSRPRRWNHDDIRAAFHDWNAAHGHYPTKAELNDAMNRQQLPAYTAVRRKFGSIGAVASSL